MVSVPIKVWYDKKRGHHASNVGFVVSQATGLHPHQASAMLLEYFKSQPEHEFWTLVEEAWVD